MTFARNLMLLLLALASFAVHAQEPATPLPARSQDTAAPAPVVRHPSIPAGQPDTQKTGETTPNKPHLTTSHPVIKPVDPNALNDTPSFAAPPKPRPVTKPSIAKSISTLPGALVQGPSGPFNRTTIFLDPSHGGGDTGSRINEQLTEKDVTLALAFRIRSLLTARGFTVVMSRDSEDNPEAPSLPLSLDDRAGLANHARPLACLLLHATASGHGVHLYTSELDPALGESSPAAWLTAQAPWVPASQYLATQMGAALSRAKIPLVLSRASVRPVDSLTCPALVVELAPNTSSAASLNDAVYQQRIAEALTGTLVAWQSQAQPPARLLPPTAPSVLPTVDAPSTPAEAKP